MKIWLAPVLAVSVGALAPAAGCSFGESGVNPPLDDIFLPGGLRVDPAGRWLYVVNSNSDLRYNAGTLVTADLDAAAADRLRTDWPNCPGPGYVADEVSEPRFCCRDYFDPTILNCKESGYIDPARTVLMGSFGSALEVEHRPGTPPDARRVYVAVRAEPSITFLDGTVTDQGVILRCRDDDQGPNPLCDDTHKVLGQTDPAKGPRLPEEPQKLVLDSQLRLLYVAHASESLSLVDICPDKPYMTSTRRPVFDQPAMWVTSLVLSSPGDAAADVFVTGRELFGRTTTGILSLRLRDADQPCANGPRRPIDLLPGQTFYPSAFYSNGSDIRGYALWPERQRAYVLHRNGGNLTDPQAVVALDRTPDAQGHPINQSLGVVEVCAGGTEMKWGNGGRGPRLYVVCFDAGQIYVIDPENVVVTGIINVGRGPALLTFSEKDPGTAYVTGFSDNNVSVVDLRAGSPTENRVIQRLGFPQLGTMQ
jgi:DNA-binding beta-propeller fold protein YncE